MLAKNFRFACIAVAGLCLMPPLPAAAQAQGTTAQPSYQLRHWNGQGLAPVYEGWDKNPDGTFNMWFGYMNRNYEEVIELPVGPANRFEPGEADRGQPTFFDTRRHKDTFRVIVPATFGETAKLSWSVTVRGKTEIVAGTLTSVWQIDRQRTTRGGNSQNINSNTPPVVTITPETQTIAPGSSASLTVSATDDGLPKRRSEGGESVPIGMTVEWAKYRGPGTVTWSSPKQPLVNGKAAATASFGEPGEYTAARRGRRWVGRVGRQLRISLLLDQRPGQGDGDRRDNGWNDQSEVSGGDGMRMTRSTHAPHRSDRPLRLPPFAPLVVVAFCAVSSALPAAAQQVTYAKDVAPIFQAKCTQCHHAGTGAPMPLTSFEEVRPWARSIKTRVSNREMPPWHLDKTVGIRHYKNDLSLNDADIATIVKWVDAGAPGGNPSDCPGAPEIRPRRRLAHRQARSRRADGRRAHDVRQRTGLVD